MISLGQWDIFCHMPFSNGTLYSFQLSTSGRNHNGPPAQKGLASLSGGNIPSYNDNNILNTESDNNKKVSIKILKKKLIILKYYFLKKRNLWIKEGL